MMQTAMEEMTAPPVFRRYSTGDVDSIVKDLDAVGSFSGCGGSSTGLRLAGFRVPYAIEFVDAAAATYVANFPDAYVDRRDIREVDPGEILARLGIGRGALDLFEGSPPCASFSSAGRGAALREGPCPQCAGTGRRDATLGADGGQCGECGGSGRQQGVSKKYSDVEQRSDDLFFEWVRILEGLYPRAFIAENVPGLIRGQAIEEYAWKISNALASIGYVVRSSVLNACYYAVPQDRRRLFFVGFRKDVDVPSSFRFPPSWTSIPPHTLRQALGSVNSLCGPTPEESDDRAAVSIERFAIGRLWHLIREGADRDAIGKLRAEIAERKALAEKLKTERPEAAKQLLAGLPEEPEQKDYFSLAIPDLDRPCPTLTATAGSLGAASVVHPTEPRKFTPAECLAISGFPVDFELTGTIEQRIERVGRAVPPPMMAAVAREVADVLRG